MEVGCACAETEVQTVHERGSSPPELQWQKLKELLQPLILELFKFIHSI